MYTIVLRTDIWVHVSETRLTASGVSKQVTASVCQEVYAAA